MNTAGAPEETEALGAYDTPPELARAIVRRVAEVTDLGLEAHRPYEQVLEPSAGGGAFVRALLDEYPDPFDRPTIEVCDVDPFAPALTDYPGEVTVTPYEAPGRIPIPRTAVRCVRCGQVAPGERHKGEPGRFPARHTDGTGHRCDGDQLHALDLDEGETCADPVRAGFLIATPRRKPTIVLGNPPYAVRVPWRTTPEPVAHLHVGRALELTGRHLFVLLRLSWIGPDRHRFLLDSGHLRGVWTVRPRPPFAWHGRTKSTDSSPSAVFWFDKSYTARRYADGSPIFEGGFIDWQKPTNAAQIAESQPERLTG